MKEFRPQNLDNWKSSRRKRQEHIIERVVEVKKLELEEHDRQRRRNKTFSEMMEERGNRGRKLSISLAMYNDEDANDLSDLGIGTSSGKSSVSGDTHDDTHSVLVRIYSNTSTCIIRIIRTVRQLTFIEVFPIPLNLLMQVLRLEKFIF